eukprot:COSAG01_NODE_16367_length_1242_cov_1.634296_1_plen_380_part_10
MTLLAALLQVHTSDLIRRGEEPRPQQSEANFTHRHRQRYAAAQAAAVRLAIGRSPPGAPTPTRYNTRQAAKTSARAYSQAVPAGEANSSLMQTMLLRVLCILAAMVMGSAGAAAAEAAASFKRGVAIGVDHPSVSNLSALVGVASWGYNWGVTSNLSDPASPWLANGLEFIPMVWDDRHLLSNGSWASAGTTQFSNASALLGFNEPNFPDQANMSPQQASQAWPSVEKLAAANSVPIVVSPAMNFNKVDPIGWLDEFFALCSHCRIDAIALHSYTCYWSFLAGHLDKYRKYNRPLWLTEFACADSSERKNQTGQMAYMKEVIPHLEADPQIYRYAWFSHDFALGPPGQNEASLVRDGSLTALGQLYGSLAGAKLPPQWQP